MDSSLIVVVSDRPMAIAFLEALVGHCPGPARVVAVRPSATVLTAHAGLVDRASVLVVDAAGRRALARSICWEVRQSRPTLATIVLDCCRADACSSDWQAIGPKHVFGLGVTRDDLLRVLDTALPPTSTLFERGRPPSAAPQWRPERDVGTQQRPTSRERQVLALVSEGKSNKQIARTIECSVRTVEFHLANASAKLGAVSRAEAAVAAWRRGWLRERELTEV